VSTPTAPIPGLRGSTPPILGPDDRPLPGSIASLERIHLGDAAQWVLLRGRDTTNPVLLFVSGCPVGSAMAQLRRHSGELEDRFTVVAWELRGTGKSLRAGFPGAAMTVRQLTADALDLVGHLRTRFGQRKIVLVGHALGTVLAIRMIQERPEWFHAYVGVGQLVNPAEHDRAAWQYALDGALRRGQDRVARRLRRHGPPPYQRWGMALRYALLDRLRSRYLGEDLGLPDAAPARVPHTGEFTPLDRMRRRLGLVRTFRLVYPRLQKLDLTTQATRLDVPVYLVAGADVIGDGKLVERYYDALVAPHKELLRYERSAHAPCFEEAERFNRWLVATVLPRTARQDTDGLVA